jgi:hypothetical protein
MPRFIADYLTGFLRCRPRPRRAAPGMRPRARPVGNPHPRVGGARLAKLLREEQQAGPLTRRNGRTWQPPAGWPAPSGTTGDERFRARAAAQAARAAARSRVTPPRGAALWHWQGGGARSPRGRCTSAIPAVSAARQPLPGGRREWVEGFPWPGPLVCSSGRGGRHRGP